jgi:two-component system response regulator RegX3
MSGMTRIVIIEDEQNLAEAIQYQLQRDGYEVLHSPDGREGLELITKQQPDLVLLDLMLPGLPGEDVCRSVRQSSDVPIIMLTARDDDIDKIVGLELGADDYLTKPFNMRELVARIKAVLRRSGPIPHDVMIAGSIELDRAGFQATIDGTPLHLPRKEFELLELLIANQGRVVTRDQLIDEIWGPDYVGDTRTLDVHIRRLRIKIESDQPDAPRLMTVRRVGYKLVV